MSKQRCSVSGTVLVIGAISVLSILLAPPLPVRAQDPEPTATPVSMPTRPPKATPSFPSRPPTITPTFTPTLTAVPGPSVHGGAIELNVQFLADAPKDPAWRDNLWTMVEWQDGLGNWHEVEHWKASLDEVKSDGGKKIWFVAEEQFGRGPFCWLVSPSLESDPIAASPIFHLPDHAGVIVPVGVQVGKPDPLPPRPTPPASMIPTTGGGAKQYLGLQAALTAFLIVMLLASLLPRNSRRRFM